MKYIRTQRHVVHALHLHLVFVSKYRRDVFTPLLRERLKYHFEFERSILKDVKKGIFGLG
jgi:REP element-mobilizing transposase RayT